MGFGTRTIGQGGQRTMASADGSPVYKVGGVTLDWSTVPTNGSDTTLADGEIILSGVKYIPFGTILSLISTAEVQTATVTGTPTGGTFTLTLDGQTTTAIAYNAAAAAVQSALQALSNIGPGNVTVTGSAGGPYTITFPASFSDVSALTASGAGLTGGSTPGVTMATTTAGVSGGGKYGPYDTGASDGRQTLSRGRCFVLNQTIKSTDLHADNPPGVFSGGRVFRKRIKSLSGGAYVTLWNSTVEAAFPMLDPVEVTQ